MLESLAPHYLRGRCLRINRRFSHHRVLRIAVLDPIYGATTATGLVIAIVAIVVNAVTIPIGFYLLNLGLPKSETGGGSLGAIINAVKQPVVWSPVFAVVLVLCGLKLPEAFYPSFELIAKANSGVAVFAAGLALATVPFGVSAEIIWNTVFRLFLSPLAICIAGALWGMETESLSMLVMDCCMPPAFSGIIISSRYNIYVATGTSSLAISVILFMVFCPLWIWITELCVGPIPGISL